MSVNTKHAAVGDTIEITHQRYFTGKQFVVVERPSTALLPHNPGDAWIIMPDGPGFWKPEHYKIIVSARDNEWAAPGDTIEITYEGLDSKGKQHLVIECPPGANNSPPGCAWHKNPGSSASFWRKEYYKIVKRKGESVSTPSIVSDTPVDLEQSLRQKRDEIMRGWFT